MNYEQKYKEALEKARQLCAYPTTKPFISDLKDLFPELSESEDDKIREALIALVKCNEKSGYTLLNNVSTSSMLAWLEKQDEPQVRTGIEWVNTIDDACDKRYSEEYAEGEYCHEQSFKWGFQEGVDWLEKQGNNVDKIKQQQAIEIPFGAKDSELQEATYYIPDGYHAEINGNEVVIKKGE